MWYTVGVEIVPTDAKQLAQHPLFRTLELGTQHDLLARFVVFTVAPHEPLIRAGEKDSSLLLLLSGSADVYVRKAGQRFRVARLHAGELMGEMAFFDPQLARSADVVQGPEPGLIALLHSDVYWDLVRAHDAGAEVIEKLVLDSLARRIRSTNELLGDLLDQHQKGGLMDALGRLFGRKGVGHRSR